MDQSIQGHGQCGFHERSRRLHRCPWQTDAEIVGELVGLRKRHPRWGLRKLLDLMHRRNPRRELPSVSTGARILAREGLVKPRRRYRRVSRAGTIRVFHNQIFVSNTLQKDYVGLEEVDDGVYDLYWCFYQIGRYELKTNKINDIVSKVGLSRRQVDLAIRV